MSTAFSLKRHDRVTAVAILLIVAVFAVTCVACDGDGNGTGTYQLAVSSASGGSVTTPGSGTFAYDAGTVVQLVASADDGYRFRSWTGDTQGIANPSAPSTTIRMNGDYAIVANFEIESEPSPGDGGPFTP